MKLGGLGPEIGGDKWESALMKGRKALIYDEKRKREIIRSKALRKSKK